MTGDDGANPAAADDFDDFAEEQDMGEDDFGDFDDFDEDFQEPGTEVADEELVVQTPQHTPTVVSNSSTYDIPLPLEGSYADNTR